MAHLRPVCHSGRGSQVSDSHLHVAIHHPPGVVGGLVEGLEVGEDLGHHTQHPQRVEVGVGKHRLLLLQTLSAQPHYLEQDTGHCHHCPEQEPHHKERVPRTLDLALLRLGKLLTGVRSQSL